MKKNTHPTYHTDAKIMCACGKIHEVGSTMKEIQVELCSSCHPFYTGKQKILDTARRVEKFAARSSAKAVTATGKKVKKEKREKQKQAKEIAKKA